MAETGGQGAGGAPAQRGLVANARRLLRILLTILSTRLELFGVEVAEQGARIGALLALGVVALLFSIFAIALFSFGIAVLFWDTHRLAAIFGLAGLYAVVTLVACVQIRTRLKNHPEPFAATIAELKADAAVLQRH
ncbi:MAG TPA: phage holin family protein [Burkholderiales bacterium]